MHESQKQRITVWITGDQCSKNNGALVEADKDSTTILLIESVARGNQLKYHKKKLVLIYSIMRHFAKELRQAGWHVDYHAESPDFKEALAKHIKEKKPEKFRLMEQSEYGALENLTKLVNECAGEKSIEVEIFPHCNFISSAAEFEKLHTTSESRVTMEKFYHAMRKKTGLLMDGDDPMGGAWNFDKNNRLPPGKRFPFKPPMTFPPDAITKEVIQMVERHFGDHPGSTESWRYAVTREDALEAARDFFDNRLDQFGPHQDAMLDGQPFLNHSVLSPYINTCLLHPLELCREAESRYLSQGAQISSVEGFIRQLIGWREFIWRVYWRLMPEYKERNSLGAEEILPDWFYTGETRMKCMSDAIAMVQEHAYAHHIVRLMLIGNFSLLAGLNPQATNDWFHEMFIDGYDWVMVPNVIGMTLHADGGYVGTKPYAASANYINKMSDYCGRCPFDPKKAIGDDACPFNSMYWNFLIHHEKRFAKNHRMAMIMKGLQTKSADWKTEITKRARELSDNRWT